MLKTGVACNNQLLKDKNDGKDKMTGFGGFRIADTLAERRENLSNTSKL